METAQESEWMPCTIQSGPMIAYMADSIVITPQGMRIFLEKVD